MLGGLGIAHRAEPIVVGVEAHDAVIANPELLTATGELDVLGRQSSIPVSAWTVSSHSIGLLLNWRGL